MFDNFYKDENGRSVFELPRQQKLQIAFGCEFISVCALMIDEKLDINKMKKTIQHAFDSYDTLRYMAVEENGDTCYKILNSYKYEFTPYIATGASYEEKYQDAIDHISEMAVKPIDIYNGLSQVIDVAVVDDEHFIFYIIAYPWTLDGSACAILSDIILTDYKGIDSKRPYAVQNHEFMEWYLELEKSEKGQKELEFWKKNNEGSTVHDLSSMYIGQPATQQDFMAPMDTEKFNDIAKNYKTSFMNVALFGYHMAIYNLLGLTDSMVAIMDSCRVKKEHIGVVGNLVRQLCHRLIFNEDTKLVDAFKNSIEEMSLCTKNHHVACSDPNVGNFAMTSNNFRQTGDFFAKNISSQIRVKRQEKDMLLLCFVELPTGFNFIYRCNSKTSKESLGIITRSVQTAVDMLINNPDITISEFKKMVMED